MLLVAGRADGAVYLCGYAIELALKARICRALDWAGYPSTNKEFEDYQSFRTHDLDDLLHLSGVENPVVTSHLTAWSVVAKWDPTFRYRLVGTVSVEQSRNMIQAAQALMGVL